MANNEGKALTPCLCHTCPATPGSSGPEGTSPALHRDALPAPWKVYSQPAFQRRCSEKTCILPKIIQVIGGSCVTVLLSLKLPAPQEQEKAGLTEGGDQRSSLEDGGRWVPPALRP